MAAAVWPCLAAMGLMEPLLEADPSPLLLLLLPDVVEEGVHGSEVIPMRRVTNRLLCGGRFESVTYKLLSEYD